MIKITKFDAAGRVIAIGETETLEQARAFLDSLGDAGSVKSTHGSTSPVGVPTLGDIPEGEFEVEHAPRGKVSSAARPLGELLKGGV